MGYVVVYGVFGLLLCILFWFDLFTVLGDCLFWVVVLVVWLGYGVASRLLHVVMLVDALLGCLLCVAVCDVFDGCWVSWSVCFGLVLIAVLILRVWCCIC